MELDNSELNRYISLTPKSKTAWEEARKYFPGGDSRNSIFWEPYPIFVQSAKGSTVIDVDNVERLDFINTMTTMIFGHSYAPVMDAVGEQLSKGVGYNAPNLHQIRLAEMLCTRIPSFDLVRFTNSGTEATLNTIRAARAFTGRTLFAKVEGGYHGTHDAVSVSVRVSVDQAGDRNNPRSVANTEGLPPDTLDKVIIIPFNEIDIALDILSRHKDDLAAVIVEPILGSVGMVPATHEFLNMLRNFTEENGIILIFDEVISYRVNDGGCQKYYGITPDMTSLGKIIGGGFPVGAFGGRKDIMDLYDPTMGPKVSHAGTFNANPVTMLAGQITMEHLTPQVYIELELLTNELKVGIEKTCADLEVFVQVTGLGSLFGIHFVDHTVRNYRDIADGDKHLSEQIFLGLMNDGILIAPNLVGALSTEIGPQEISIFCQTFKSVLSRNI